MQLKGKTVLVTGSSCGIGKAIALAMANEGADIIIDHLDEEIKAMEVKRLIEEKGRKVLVFKTDVSDKDAVEKMIEKSWSEFGKIDILVNNAGIGPATPFLKIEEDEWDRVLGVNLKGMFLCSQAVARRMVDYKVRGKIINITSINGFQAEKERVSYDSSKGGIIALTQTVAAELGEYGINVNAIAPGVISGTDIDKEFFNDDDNVKKILSKTPLGRFGTVEDCANLAVFLASERSDFIQGEVIVLDGGLSTLQFP